MTSDPKRLTVVGATDLERTLLGAARRERPSPELTARMAAGLGISAAASTTAAAPAVTAKTSLVGWASAGVVAAAVVAGIVGVRLSGRREPARAARAAVTSPVVVAVEDRPSVAPPMPPPRVVVRDGERRIERPEKVRRRAPAAPPAADLRDQIALMDAARTAVRSGQTERSLALLRRYDASFPTGAFRPEALALRIEALAADGRGGEARALAREFLARYPQSPLGDRVARVSAPR